jgi:hypothetical protein
MRYEMWDNRTQGKMVNLTSHIAHPTSVVENLFPICPADSHPSGGFPVSDFGFMDTSLSCARAR